MIELYHAGVSTCSQKVRLVLAEKGLYFKAHDVDLVGGAQHHADYTKLNPEPVVALFHENGAAVWPEVEQIARGD